MHVLWFSNETPDVMGQGGQRRQYFQIKTLVNAGHDLTVITLAGPQNHCSARSLATVLRVSLHGRQPFARRRERTHFRKIIGSTSWDKIVVAHLDSWLTLQNQAAVVRAPILLDVHNVLSRWYSLKQQDNLSDRWRAIEALAAKDVAAVSVCSERERSAMQDSTGVDALIVPHGIEPSQWSFLPAPRAAPVIKLFGNWDWDPNRQGLGWFLQEVWPSLASASRVTCEIAGNGFAIDQAACRGVTAVGRVASVSEFLCDAWVVAVPVINGVGAPVKYAEALVAGVPLVTTLEAADAISVAGSLISDDPHAWVRWIGDVLRAPERMRVEATARRELAMKDRSWERVSEPLTRWIAEM